MSILLHGAKLSNHCNSGSCKIVKFSSTLISVFCVLCLHPILIGWSQNTKLDPPKISTKPLTHTVSIYQKWMRKKNKKERRKFPRNLICKQLVQVDPGNCMTNCPLLPVENKGDCVRWKCCRLPDQIFLFVQICFFLFVPDQIFPISANLLLSDSGAAKLKQA